ncbi:hypothetical protein [Haloferula sp. BvORR071]|uniref:hypothetical protein n=1 Tax=Haloferula sp. BvORR071 TaxID=1396141 RepID=UPI000553CDC2|nr:hypothetical protein [Haloferula sp. BvORR071]
MTEGEKNALGFLAAKLNANDAPAVRKACVVLRDSWPPETLAPLCICYWHAPAEIRQLIAATLLDLATALPTPLWPKIDEEIRETWPRYGPAPAGDFPPEAGSVLVALCHPSGHVRERATTISAVLPPLLAASLLLVRLNDWVTAVEERASSELEPTLDRLSSAEKMAVAPLVARLRTCGRRAKGWWHGKRRDEESAQIEFWFDHLAAFFDPEAWKKLWAPSRGEERRVYLELLKRSKIKPGPDIRRNLFGSNDRAALLWYIQDVLPSLGEDERSEATEAVARSRAVPVRRLWLTRQMELDPPAAIKELGETLINRSRSLRHFARFHLSRLAPTDFAAHYRARLDVPELEPWALRGLVEVSSAAARPEILARLESPHLPTRTAAIECLDTDALGEHIDFLLQTMASDLPAPARAARKHLAKVTTLLGPHLLAIPDQVAALPIDVRLHLVRLAPFFGKWHGLEFLLQMMQDKSMVDDIQETLRNWQYRENRSFIRLDPAKRAVLLELLASVNLGEGLKKSIHYILERSE